MWSELLTMWSELWAMAAELWADIPWGWLSLAAHLIALASIPSVIVKRRGRPLAALSWILTLLAVPYLGLWLWWLIGRRHLERKRRVRAVAHKKIASRLESLCAELEPAPETAPPTTPALLPIFRLPAELAGSVFKPTSGNRVKLLTDGEDAFATLEEVVQAAEHHIHALYYIWKNDETGRRLRDLLAAKARDGVEVRVLCDAVGAPIMGRPFARPLRRAGAKVARFLPPRVLTLAPRLNFRNHRKILVADGKVGVIGGFNIADEYRTTWRDCGVRIEGPAVDQLQEVFIEDWYFATRENLADEGHFSCWQAHHGPDSAACAVVASGPDTRYEPIHDALFVAMNQAGERLWITTPYFIPSRALLASIRAAIYRGVDVRIMLPAKNDLPIIYRAARSFYPELLDVGARIFEYQPAMLHAKTVVFDRQLVMIGSSNMDTRSFRLNFEASAFLSSAALNAELAAVYRKDQEHCAEIRLEDMRRSSWAGKVIDGAAHLLSPLL